jgi:hypothetical protein
MKAWRFVLAVALLVATTGSLSAQKAADAVTGTWTGSFQIQESQDSVDVTMKLKLDQSGAVSGTVTGLPTPAEVKSGTFESRTGALKLQLGKVGEKGVLLVLDGAIKDGRAQGKIVGDGNGTFSVARQ